MTTCLVVDDSRVIRKVAKRILEDFDMTVHEACDGQKALEHCRQQMPDAILLDWNMPVMNGIEFLRALRQEQDGQTPKVVLCTTENDFDHITQALEAGASEYIMKPFDKEILMSKLIEAGVVSSQ